MKRIPRILAVAALSSALALSTACGGGEDGNTDDQKPGDVGGSVSMAMRTPTWILPISQPGKTQGENAILQMTMFKPLFAYEMGTDAKYNINETRSLGRAPEVSSDGLTYTITLQDNTWSDGTAITTRDVEFWWNLVTVNKEDWASYREGGFPDNVKEFKVVDEKKFTLTTTTQFNPGWYINNQLNRITPMPQHAWDKDADDAQVGDLDRTDDGAKAVFGYLVAASEDTASYGSNKLWQTVSGPYRISEYTPNGETTITINDGYSGTDKPTIKDIVFRPFTGDDAEFNVLRAAGIDYGYIPAGSVSQKSVIEGKGYTVEPWSGWSITYMPFNFSNPKSGPIFQQKYIRQAMQQLIDQETISRVIWQGTAAPTCGPVPQSPDEAGTMAGCAYQFDPEAAKALLEGHGWKINPDGASTCENPGTGADQCGEGIAKGTALSFTVISQTGFSATTKMFTELKSQFAQVGIDLTIKEVPDSVAVSQPCEEGASCDWDLSFFGSQSSWYYPVYASGERLFGTEAPVNLGRYSDKKADELIAATTTAQDDKALQAYDDYLAEDLPVLWMPNPVAQTSAWKSTIEGVGPQDPLLYVYPQDWRLK